MRASTSGSAASGKIDAATKAEAARLVESLPVDALELITDRRPIERAAAEALLRGDRTPMQLSERARDRWVSWGYRAQQAGGMLRKPEGAMISLWRPGPCPDPRCDEGRNVDTGQPCPRCEEQRQDRRGSRVPAARDGVQGEIRLDSRPQQSAPVRVECIDCQAPMLAGGQHERCRECREVLAVLVDTLGGEMAEDVLAQIPADVREDLAADVETEGREAVERLIAASMREAGVIPPTQDGREQA